MPRRGRLYVPIDINLVSDARAAGLTDTAIVLFIAILADCKQRRTDGVIARSTLGQLGVNAYWHPLKILLRSGWIRERDDGHYEVPSWTKWHDTQADVSARQTADRHRKRITRSIPQSAWRLPD